MFFIIIVPCLAFLARGGRTCLPVFLLAFCCVLQCFVGGCWVGFSGLGLIRGGRLRVLVSV